MSLRLGGLLAPVFALTLALGMPDRGDAQPSFGEPAVSLTELDFTRERVEFLGSEGDKVPAYLYKPSTLSTTEKTPAVLLQYGLGGNKDTDYIVEIGGILADLGFIVLTIDSPEQGERKPASGLETPQLGPAGYGLFRHFIADYGSAVDYLLTLPEVDPARIGYVGISWGAITGIPFAANDPRIAAVGSIVGGAGMVPVTPPLWDPARHVAKLAGRPLVLVNATRDQLVKERFGKTLHKKAPAEAVRIWLDTDHYLTGIDRRELTKTVITAMFGSLD